MINLVIIVFVLRDYVGPPICVDEDSEDYCPGKIPGVSLMYFLLTDQDG